MRFRFCGDVDAPDWLLAEMNTLSRLSSVRVRVLVGQVLGHLADGQALDPGKCAKLVGGGVSELDVQAAVSALHFILASAGKHSVDDTQLAKELLQLGLPKEHTDSVARPYAQRYAALRTALLAATPRMGDAQLVAWQVVCPLAGSSDTPAQPHARLEWELRAPGMRAAQAGQQQHGRRVTMAVSAEQLRLLVHELGQARAVMNEVRTPSSDV